MGVRLAMKWLAVTVIVLLFLALPFLIYSGEDQSSVGPTDPPIQEYELESAMWILQTWSYDSHMEVFSILDDNLLDLLEFLIAALYLRMESAS